MPNQVSGNMDGILRRMANGFTRQQRISVNEAGMDAYESAFRTNFKNTMTNDKNDGNSILQTLTREKTPGGAVAMGFSKQGKKAYLARFQNDGWIPRNQYGGPYAYHPERRYNGGKPVEGEVELPMVTGKHFWEKTNNDQNVRREIGRHQARRVRVIMSSKIHGGA